ncbi:MAG: hypothetical protein P4M12_02420, partial [Gammaproteobacteria bacterium]|nr:hypothetical protein [Gammaproteobacteria bacterium]
MYLTERIRLTAVELGIIKQYNKYSLLISGMLFHHCKDVKEEAKRTAHLNNFRTVIAQVTMPDNLHATLRRYSLWYTTTTIDEVTFQSLCLKALNEQNDELKQIIKKALFDCDRQDQTLEILTPGLLKNTKTEYFEREGEVVA